MSFGDNRQVAFFQVHVVLPQPGSNNAHRVDKNLKKELFDKAQLIEDVPFAKEIFQVSLDGVMIIFALVL